MNPIKVFGALLLAFIFMVGYGEGIVVAVVFLTGLTLFLAAVAALVYILLR